MVLIWNGKKWFLDIQNGYRRTFKKKLQKKLSEWFEQCSNRLLADCNLIYIHVWSIYIYRHVCWERGNIQCVRPLIGRMHTIVVKYVRICTKGVSCFPHNISEESAQSVYTYQRERDYNFNYFVHIIMIITSYHEINNKNDLKLIWLSNINFLRYELMNW